MKERTEYTVKEARKNNISERLKDFYAKGKDSDREKKKRRKGRNRRKERVYTEKELIIWEKILLRKSLEREVWKKRILSW